ncbi:MAG TPA: hypothetical protein V6C81_15715 [Planktothrix sp.]
MACNTHTGHDHKHGQSCGHKAVQHGDHTCYLHDDHLHHVHDDHIDEHSLSEETHSSSCTPEHACGSHDSSHKHGPECGHDAVPHSNHVDYLVAGHLHHPCGNHCDHHGKLMLA